LQALQRDHSDDGERKRQQRREDRGDAGSATNTCTHLYRIACVTIDRRPSREINRLLRLIFVIAMVRTRADGLIGSQSWCATFTITSSASMPAALSILTSTATATVEILN
jgi:hypothetical protein